MVMKILIVLLLAAPDLRAQTPAGDAEPDFSITVQGTFDPATLREFNRRVTAFAALRDTLEVALPPLQVTERMEEVEHFETTLARRLRAARSPRRGQVFTASMARQVRRMIERNTDKDVITFIMEDGPGEFEVDVNASYSKERALSTMPPRILLLLPDLPYDLEYRFVGRHLILRDRRSNTIVDAVPYAIQCRDCVLEPEDDH
jgi:hypothetical protein